MTDDEFEKMVEEYSPYYIGNYMLESYLEEEIHNLIRIMENKVLKNV